MAQFFLTVFFVLFCLFFYFYAAASHQSVSCPLDGKFSVLRPFSHASRLPCSSDSMANDVSSAVATPHLFLAGQRTSAIAVGCSAQDTLDLYHECSRETSTGWTFVLFCFVFTFFSFTFFTLLARWRTLITWIALRLHTHLIHRKNKSRFSSNSFIFGVPLKSRLPVSQRVERRSRRKDQIRYRNSFARGR